MSTADDVDDDGPEKTLDLMVDRRLICMAEVLFLCAVVAVVVVVVVAVVADFFFGGRFVFEV